MSLIVPAGQGIWLISALIVQKWAEGLGLVLITLRNIPLRFGCAVADYAGLCRNLPICNVLILFVSSSGSWTLNQQIRSKCVCPGLSAKLKCWRLPEIAAREPPVSSSWIARLAGNQLQRQCWIFGDEAGFWKLTVTCKPWRTFVTSAGRKQAMHVPVPRRTLGYKITAELAANSSLASACELA